MKSFQDSLDIANRALDHCGHPPILTIGEESKAYELVSRVYDKLRQAELQRNLWRFSRKKAFLRPLSSTCRLLAPHAWVEGETYLPGSIVADTNGDLWISFEPDNQGNEPGVSPVWDAYFGQMALDAYDAEITYRAGELVYAPLASAGSFGIFLSLEDDNDDDPETSTAYVSTTTYGLNDRVSSGGFIWRSLITLNLGITPAVAPADYSAGTTYNSGSTAVASDGYIYTCTTNGTVGVDPVTDDGTFWTKGAAAAWAKTPTQFSASKKWLPIFADMTNLPIEWMYVAAGETSLAGRRSVFRLPAGYLRSTRTGRRIAMARTDHDPVGDYIVSADANILLEFGGDIVDVRKMHALYCEGLACRIAEAICIPLTQDKTLLASITSEYAHFMGEARIVNAIEVGEHEPEEDELITVRR